MFESTAEDRMKAFRRRNGVVHTRGGVTPEIMRRHAQPVRMKAVLLAEISNPLDFGREVYCSACATRDRSETITAYPLLALQAPNPMSDKGDMLSFTCLHCGFVEHHSAPKSVEFGAYKAAAARVNADNMSFQDYVNRVTGSKL